MIDTHCHLLPGIDDGPETRGDALALARDLVAQGVQTTVCTPHWSRQFATTHGDAVAAGELLRAALLDEGIPLHIVIASELSDVIAATRPLEEIRERSIGGRFAVVEMLSGSLPVQVTAIISRLAAGGLTTVLAHPERCRAVQEDTSTVDRFRTAGAQVQVVAPSLTGRWGERPQAAAWALIASGRADLLASDAHDMGKRPCELGAVQGLVVERLGHEHWELLTGEGPRRLLVGLAPLPTP